MSLVSVMTEYVCCLSASREWMWLGRHGRKQTSKRVLWSYWGLWQCVQLYRPCSSDIQPWTGMFSVLKHISYSVLWFVDSYSWLLIFCALVTQVLIRSRCFCLATAGTTWTSTFTVSWVSMLCCGKAWEPSSAYNCVCVKACAVQQPAVSNCW